MSDRRLNVIIAATVAALAFLVYADSLRYGFVFDEQTLIRDNPLVYDLGNTSKILTQKFWPGPSRGIYYRPAVTLSYALGYALAGDAPWIQHLINNLAHAGCAAMVFFLLMRLGIRRAAAAFGSLLFAVHPIHTESVAWAPGRTDVLAFMFMAGAWLLLLRGREREGKIKTLYLIGAALVYVLALGAKEVAIALVPIIFIQDLLLGRENLKRRWVDYAAMAAITFIFMAWRFHVLSGPGPDPAPNALAGVSPTDFLVSVAMVFAYSLRSVFVPLTWKIDLAYTDDILSAPLFIKALSLFAAAALFAAMAALWKKKPLLSFLAAGFFLSVLPVSHLIGFPTLFAERFMYLPSFFACAALAVWVSSFKDSKTLRSALALLLILLAIFSAARGRVFRDQVTFWERAVSQAPHCALARNWLGVSYRGRSDFDAARRQYLLAIAADPKFSSAMMNLSEIYLREGDTERAIEILKRAEQITPDSSGLASNLGLAYSMEENWVEAKAQWERALRLDPNNRQAHFLLARYYESIEKNPAKAGEHYRAAGVRR